MIDIEKIKPEIVKSLKPLNPEKIILFGTYAYGHPDDKSDIDLFLVKKGLSKEEQAGFEKRARKTSKDFFEYRGNGQIFYSRDSVCSAAVFSVK